MESKKLFDAVEAESIEAIGAALTAGADVNSKNSSGNTALHESVLRANGEELVKFLIEAGADVNLVNGRGKTALEWFLDNPFYVRTQAIVELLVNAGANVNSRNREMVSVLHYAVVYNNVDFIPNLLSRGADVNAADVRSWTVLHDAARNVEFDTTRTSTIEVLLAVESVDVNPRDNYGNTPVQVLVKKPCNDPEYLRNLVRIIDLFAARGADFNSRNDEGKTVMDLVVSQKNSIYAVDLVLAFVRHGMSINHVYTTIEVDERRKRTILHNACRRGDKNMIKALLKRGADVNILDSWGRSPLFYLGHRPDLFNYLIKWNADVNVIEKYGTNVLTCWEFEPDEPKYCFWSTVIRHLAILRASEREIHEGILKTVEKKPEYRRYFERCNRELRKIKNRELGFKGLTYFDLLTERKSKLVTYAGNDDLVKDFEKNNGCEKYSIYGKTIVDRFTKAVKFRVVLERSAVVLSQCLPCGLDSEHLVVKKILSFCETKDLRRLSFMYHQYTLPYDE